MKLNIVLILALCATPVAFAQDAASVVAQRAKDADWSKLTPGMLDMAFDWVDANERAFDVIDKSDEVYAPREEEADKLRQKLQRLRESDADQAAYIAAAEYSFRVSSCRLMLTSNIAPPECAIPEVSKLHDSAEQELKYIQRMSRQASAVPPQGAAAQPAPQ